MPAEQKAQYETSMKELSIYCKEFERKYGPMRSYPQKTQFDPSIHFEPTSIHTVVILDWHTLYMYPYWVSTGL